MAAKAKQTALDKIETALDGAHAHLDKAQALQDGFGKALKEPHHHGLRGSLIPISLTLTGLRH